jgi:hypothetical protein
MLMTVSATEPGPAPGSLLAWTDISPMRSRDVDRDAEGNAA